MVRQDLSILQEYAIRNWPHPASYICNHGTAPCPSCDLQKPPGTLSAFPAGTYGASSCGGMNKTACYYNAVVGTYCSSIDFYCGCMENSDGLEWRADPACIATSSGAVTTSPAICRYHKYRDASQWWMGWIASPSDYCETSKIRFGENGTVIKGAGVIGSLSFGMQVLCLAPQGKQTWGMFTGECSGGMLQLLR